MKLKHFVMVGLAGAVVGWLATHAEPSDWRYPKMLITQLPKMPFRYFV